MRIPSTLAVLLVLAGCGRQAVAPPASAVVSPPVSPAPPPPPPPVTQPAVAPAPAAFVTHVSGAGRPVVFIPDLGAPGDVWDTTVAHLGGKVEAHVVEVAGFAGNAAVDGALMPMLHDQLATYVREHARGAVLVGHMFGAQVAYWVAMTEPDLVSGVVAIDAPPSRFDGAVDPEAVEGRDGLRAMPPEVFARAMKGRVGSMMKDQARAQGVGEKAARSSQPVVAETFYDSMTRDLRTGIPNIHAPVLTFLTTGNLPPPMLPVVEASYRKQLGPVAHHEVVVVAGAKHYVMFDAPDVYFAKLDKFLAATAAPR